jgi:hypothetical protein
MRLTILGITDFTLLVDEVNFDVTRISMMQRYLDEVNFLGFLIGKEL